MNHREMFNEVVLSTKYPGCMPKVKRLAQLIRDDNPKLADEDCVTMALEKYEEMTGNYLDPTQEEWSEILDALHPASTQSKIKEEKTVDTINLLPEFCYSVSGSTGELIIIKRGENGYYPCSLSTDSAEKNKELMTFNNKKLGVEETVRRAMEFGSMFGWDCPGANPGNWTEALAKQAATSKDM